MSLFISAPSSELHTASPAQNIFRNTTVSKTVVLQELLRGEKRLSEAFTYAAAPDKRQHPLEIEFPVDSRHVAPASYGRPPNCGNIAAGEAETHFLHPAPFRIVEGYIHEGGGDNFSVTGSESGFRFLAGYRARCLMRQPVRAAFLRHPRALDVYVFLRRPVSYFAGGYQFDRSASGFPTAGDTRPARLRLPSASSPEAGRRGAGGGPS